MVDDQQQQPPSTYPRFAPFQLNNTEEEALDWHLERLYQLCIFQKAPPPQQPILDSTKRPPSRQSPKFQNGKVTALHKTSNSMHLERPPRPLTLNVIEIGREFFNPFLEQFPRNLLVDWFIRLYLRIPAYLRIHEANNTNRNYSRHGLNFSQYFFQVIFALNPTRWPPNF